MGFDLTGKAVKKLRLPTVDYSNHPIVVIDAQKNDINSRYLSVSFFDDRGILDMSAYEQEGSEIVLTACMPNGEVWCSKGETNGGAAVCKLTPKMLSQQGKVTCDITLQSKDKNGQAIWLTSQSFYLDVAYSPIEDGSIEDTSEYNLALEIIERTEALFQQMTNSETERVSAESAREGAEERRETVFYTTVTELENKVNSLINSIADTGVLKGRSTTLTVGFTADCDYNIVQLGLEDSAQVAVNMAIDALPLGGGKIVLREGTYVLSDKVVVNKDGVLIEGCGNSTKITNPPHAVGAHVSIDSVNGFAVKLCRFENMYASAVLVSNSTGIRMDQNEFAHCSRGISAGGCDDIVVDKNSFSDCGDGVVGDSTKHMQITSNVFVKTGSCIRVQNGREFLFIGGNVCDYGSWVSIGGTAIDVDLLAEGVDESCVISGNTCKYYLNNIVARTYISQDGYLVETGGGIISNNICCDGENGIYADGLFNISGNQCRRITTGIEVVGAFSNISSNIVTSHGLAILFLEESHHNFVTGNILSQSSTGSIQDDGYENIIGNNANLFLDDNGGIVNV